MVFENPSTVKITAKISGSDNSIVFDGVTSDTELTPENAASQINKIFDIVNKSVVATQMKRTIIQEAFENG